MDVEGIASIITLVDLAKEISVLAKALVRDVRSAPKAIAESSNHISMLVLELECIDQLQQKEYFESLFTSEEMNILIHSLSIAKNSVMAIHNDVSHYSRNDAIVSRRPSRFSWALFDRTKFNNSLEQLQRTESRLLFVLQLINMYVTAVVSCNTLDT